MSDKKDCIYTLVGDIISLQKNWAEPFGDSVSRTLS